MIDEVFYTKLIAELSNTDTTLVAVSKTKPVEDILALYNLGQRDFGENYVQELVEKQAQLPADIRWHFIGHLQSNKVKYIAPFVSLIHGVDSLKLLQEINKQGVKHNRIIDCLLQIYIAQEETKFGLDEEELAFIHKQLDSFTHARIIGYMGMASFTEDQQKIRKEFQYLKSISEKYRLPSMVNGLSSPALSMGMSADYKIAIEESSNMIRIGSLLFGSRS
ncbi:MAG: YggS family pyridoxal phosphate-dependent enzyme [Sediminibacterium sp.]|nr:YggS family pyridoxal phosphate-dependent enzyme [Sediminibacterium sp.]